MKYYRCKIKAFKDTYNVKVSNNKDSNKKETGAVILKKIMITLLGSIWIICILGISACSSQRSYTGEQSLYDGAPACLIGTLFAEIEENPILEILYERSYMDMAAAASRQEEGPDVMRSIIDRFGRFGYAAVDSRNQIDMSGAEQVMEFGRLAEAGEAAAITMIVVSYEGSFTQYDCRTQKGAVDIVRRYFRYESGTPGHIQNKSTDSFPADTWQYTEEGYLLFSGTYFANENYVLTLSEGTERTALRVAPLDETCRELNRKYIFPLVGYGGNNIFLTDWNEKDFGELDLYDVYDICYRLKNGEPHAYTADDSLTVGAVYNIPQEEFENVIQSYFPIDCETLREDAAYNAEKMIYEYRPRGFYENDYAEIPYPEVTDYQENTDGTITLNVNAVYPYEGSSRAFSHSVTLRLFDDGRFQYLSNEITFPQNGCDAWWHAERFTKEEWEAVYGEDERENSKDNAGDRFGNDIESSMENGAELKVKALADKGKCVIGTGTYDNMNHYQKFEAFLEQSEAGRSGTETLYTVTSSGDVRRQQYLFDGTDMYVLSENTAGENENRPAVVYGLCTKLAEWEYTENGYFAYKLCVREYPEVTEVVDGSRLIRVRPMTEVNKELSLKYVARLGYQGHNLLRCDWDAAHMEELDYNGIYEYLYAMKYHESFQAENDPAGIPKEEFERLIMEYLPVTSEKLQEYSVFNDKLQTYGWAKLGCFNYTPAFFDTSYPEVTGSRQNGDGTLTMTVNAVCEMMTGDDALITHELTVRIKEDGSFQYLGNSILYEGGETIPAYQYRIVDG